MSLNTIEILDKRPFKHTHIGVGNLPTTFLDSLSYYEQLSWLCHYVTETLIPKINENINLSNQIINEFNTIRDEVDDAKQEVATLTQKVLDLTVKLAEEIQKNKDYVDEEIIKLSSYLELLISTQIKTLNDELHSEVSRLDEKIENFPLKNTIFYNPIRGTETTLEIYLQDLLELLRNFAITASEFDELELTATQFDEKEITAYLFDFRGKLILTGSVEVSSIVLYNETGNNTDGTMTQKAITEALEAGGGGGGGSPAFNNHHNFIYASFGIGYDGYQGSGLVKVDETSDGLAIIRGSFKFSDPFGSRGAYKLEKIGNTEYYGCYLGTFDYKPSEIKIIERCYNYFNASFPLNISGLVSNLEPYYLPLVIDTDGKAYIFAQEDMMGEPELAISTDEASAIMFNNCLIDIKNASNLIN